MMFLGADDDLLAISQPAHAWVSGQLLRHWAPELDEPLLLAAEQHDLAWLDWERNPSFDAATGRPHLFRDVGAAAHAPRWAEAVARAHAAWGPHVALLISRHGNVIYTRFTDRHRMSGADAEGASRYLAEQAPLQAAWAQALGLGQDQLDRETDLIALADTLSLGLCGGLPLPLDLHGPGPTTYRLARQDAAELTFSLTPWPFRSETVHIATAARPLPGRFDSEDAMRAWSHSTSANPLQLTLRR